MQADVRVEGLRELARSVRRVSDQFPKELRDINKAVVTPIAEDARRRVKSRSGRLARTVKPQASQRYARVAAGRKGLDRRTGYSYAGVNHFGGYPGSYRGNPFLTDAMDAGRERALDEYLKLTDQFLDRVWESIP